MREIASCLDQAASSVARAALDDCRRPACHESTVDSDDSTLRSRLLDLKDFLDVEEIHVASSEETQASSDLNGVELLPAATGNAASSDGAVLSPSLQERDGATLCCPFAPRRRRRPLPEPHENADLPAASLLQNHRFVSSSTSPSRLPFQSSSLSCM